MNQQCKWCKKLTPKSELWSVAVTGGHDMVCQDCFDYSRIQMCGETR